MYNSVVDSLLPFRRGRKQRRLYTLYALGYFCLDSRDQRRDICMCLSTIVSTYISCAFCI